MANRQWRDRLTQQLYRHRLPKAYVDRFVEELTDHATDFLMENNSMDAERNLEARLGSPEQLAAVARSEYQRRTFAGRHPLLTFVVGPIVSLVATFLGIVLPALAACWLIDLAAGGSLSANGESSHPPTALEVGLVQAFNLTIRFVPFVLSAWLFVYLGRRSGLRAWSLTACGIVTLCAATFVSIFTPAEGTSKATWMIGFGIGSNFGLDQIVQAVALLAFVAGMFWQSQRNQTRALALDHPALVAASNEYVESTSAHFTSPEGP